jgi:hypothetical protein
VLFVEVKMTSGNRRDPVEILALVGGSLPGIGGSGRAFEVIINKIQKAGWQIAEPTYQDTPGSTECGYVVIEGISYKVHYGRRVRLDLIDDSGGELRQRPILGFAAWVEPDLDGYGID